jgi:hypothetical protein
VKRTLKKMRRNRPAKIAGGASALLLSIVSILRADVPNAVTMDLPLPADAVMPSWIGHPETPASTFATLDLPILTPSSTNASLLVTVYFKEKPGGFLRIVWKGTQGAQILSDNFYEDIGMSNQRSLLISSSQLVGDGTLSFQCGDATLGIQRIKLEWLQPKDALVSPDVMGEIVAPAVGTPQTALAFNGAKSSAQSGAWQDDVVSVPLTDVPARIEQGVEFSVDLDKVPGLARLALKETGLPMGQRLVVWINEKRAGTITPAVPDLLDDGFTTDAADSSDYVGWRDGSFYVPVALLKNGVNTVQFSQEDDGSSSLLKATAGDNPLALKSIVMQLDYESAPLTSAVPTPQLATTPTGPIAPDAATTTSPSTP